MRSDNRISELQAERQFLLTYAGPLMLWLVPGIYGRTGLLAIGLILLLLGGWVFLLHRQLHVYRCPQKYWSKGIRVFLLVGYESYLFITGGWIAIQAGKIIREYMIQGISVSLASGIFILAALGSSTSAKTRGIFAQAVWPVIGTVFLLFLLAAALQGNPQGGNVKEIYCETGSIYEEFGKQMSWLAVMFVGIFFLPFLEIESKTDSGQFPCFLKALGKIGLWMAGLCVLIFRAFGSAVPEQGVLPILNLMAGVKIPGGFIRRVDLIFLSLVLFCLLFSMGSILFYSRHILGTSVVGRIPATILIFLLSTLEWGSWSLQKEYPSLVLYIFLPFFLAVTAANAIVRRRKYERVSK